MNKRKRLSTGQKSYNVVTVQERTQEKTSGSTKMSYVTLEEGTDFRKIAQIMTEAGYQMNHATARNVLMTSLTNLLKHISTEMNVQITDNQIKEMLREQKSSRSIVRYFVPSSRTDRRTGKNKCQLTTKQVWLISSIF